MNKATSYCSRCGLTFHDWIAPTRGPRIIYSSLPDATATGETTTCQGEGGCGVMFRHTVPTRGKTSKARCYLVPNQDLPPNIGPIEELNSTARLLAGVAKGHKNAAGH